MTGSRDQQLAQFASSCRRVSERPRVECRAWFAVTHPVIPDELDDLAGVRVLVGRLGQPADHGLVVSLVSSLSKPKREVLVSFSHVSCLWQQRLEVLPAGCMGRT